MSFRRSRPAEFAAGAQRSPDEFYHRHRRRRRHFAVGFRCFQSDVQLRYKSSIPFHVQVIGRSAVVSSVSEHLPVAAADSFRRPPGRGHVLRPRRATSPPSVFQAAEPHAV